MALVGWIKKNHSCCWNMFSDSYVFFIIIKPCHTLMLHFIPGKMRILVKIFVHKIKPGGSIQHYWKKSMYFLNIIINKNSVRTSWTLSFIPPARKYHTLYLTNLLLFYWFEMVPISYLPVSEKCIITLVYL